MAPDRLTSRLVVALATAALFAWPATAVAQEPPPPGGAQEWAVGGFEDMFCRFGFSAHSGPDGQRPRGYLTQTCGDGTIFNRGPVVCVQVEGNRAGFVWQLAESNEPGQRGRYQLFSVEDNGPPGAGMTDFVGSVGNFATPPATCPPGPTPYPVLKGNVVVKDSDRASGTAAPTVALAAGFAPDGTLTTVAASSLAGTALPGGSYFSLAPDGTTVLGAVTCLAVAENVATVGVAVAASSDLTRLPGSGFYAELQDNGPPAGGQWASRLALGWPLATAPTSCPPSAAPTAPLDRPVQVVAGG